MIAAMQVTLDGYSCDQEGQADWVDSWADGLGLLGQVDAFVLGAGMFPDYEAFWTTTRDQPATAGDWLGATHTHVRSSTPASRPRHRTWSSRQRLRSPPGRRRG